MGALTDLVNAIVWPAGTGLTDTRLARVWAGRNGRLTFDLQLTLHGPSGASRHSVQGVVSISSPPNRIVKQPIRFEHGSLLGILRTDPVRFAWLSTPDCDPELPPARRLFRPRGLHDLLADARFARIAPAGQEPSRTGSPAMNLVSYRVGRRFVAAIRTDDDGARLFVKGFRRMPGPTSLHRAAELAAMLATRSSGEIRVPLVRGALPELGLLISDEVWPAPSPVHYAAADVALAARVAAAIHSLPCVGDERVHRAADEWDTVDRWHDVLGVLCPHVATPLQEIRERLRDQTPTAGRETMTLIHRDFHHAQLLRNERAIWLVDWDTLCLGHPEQDIATYAAHAVLDAALGSVSGDDGFIRLNAFLDAHHNAGGMIDSPRLGWYLAVALARVAAMHTARGFPDGALAPVWQLALAISDNTGLWTETTRRNHVDIAPSQPCAQPSTGAFHRDAMALAAREPGAA
ncbi:MAG: phosphotransferase [Phycisphaerales bacterium]|nr:phosphotransferase [Phycisphaerales bacterium]